MKLSAINVFSLCLLVNVFASRVPQNHEIQQSNRKPEQQIRCGMRDPTSDEKAASDKVVKGWIETHGALEKVQVVQIDVYFHTIQSALGSDGPSSVQVADSISVLNNAFFPYFTFRLIEVSRYRSNNWYNLAYGSSAEMDMKAELRKGDCTSLNVYAIGNSKVLGWGTFPQECGNNESADGVVIYNESVPGGTSAPYNEGDTLVHETGHWLGLFHTFHNGCDSGDLVSDTPPELSPAFGCPTGRDTCEGDGPDPITNFMDYTDDDCMSEFTTLQQSRMQASWLTYRRFGATFFPTAGPTISPSSSPSTFPTQPPTNFPSRSPTTFPTTFPTKSPSNLPSGSPSDSPSGLPTSSHSQSPTNFPSEYPTGSPSTSPSSSPMGSPSRFPTFAPSSLPTGLPTFNPTSSPTFLPTRIPTVTLTSNPTSATETPSNLPSAFPTASPTIRETVTPHITSRPSEYILTARPSNVQSNDRCPAGMDQLFPSVACNVNSDCPPSTFCQRYNKVCCAVIDGCPIDLPPLLTSCSSQNPVDTCGYGMNCQSGTCEPVDICVCSKGSFMCYAAQSKARANQECPYGHTELNLNLAFDDYANENRWILRNECSGRIQDYGGPFDRGTPSYDLKTCVYSEARYVLGILDTYGDGICCEHGSGNYSLGYNDAVISSGEFKGAATYVSFGEKCTNNRSFGNLVCLDNMLLVDVSIVFDNYPSETSWALINDCTGEFVKSGEDYKNTEDHKTSEAFCVPPAKYTFTILDSRGDGLCCSNGDGSYKITYDEIELHSGGHFGESESITFGGCPSNILKKFSSSDNIISHPFSDRRSPVPNARSPTTNKRSSITNNPT